MNTWNSTCAISNLPIQHGDRVIAIPIVENLYKSNLNMTVPTALFQPFCGSLKGAFDGCGGIEFCENEYILKGIEFLTDSNMIYGYQKGDSAQKFTQALSYGDIFIKSFISDKQILQANIIFILEDVYVTVQNKIINQKNIFDIDKVCVEQILEHKKKMDEIFSIKELENFTVSSTIRTENALGHYLERTLNPIVRSISSMPHYYINHFIFRCIAKKMNVSDEIFKLSIIYYAMTKLRKGYIPPFVTGSQDGVDELVLEVIRVSKNIANKKNKI